MRRAFVIGVAFIVATLLPGRADALDWTGDSLTATFQDPDAPYTDGGVSITVPGTGAASPGLLQTLNVDVTATQISLYSPDSSVGQIEPDPFDGEVIVDNTQSIITGVSVDASSTLPGFDNTFLTFTPNSISINLAGLDFTGGPSVTAVVDVTFLSPAPEPATGLLMAAGLIGLGVIRRRGQYFTKARGR